MHFNTPKLTVVDPRGLPIRSVDYWRAIEGAAVEPRVERTCHDAAGRPVQRWDARLWALQAGDPATPPNQQTVYSLDAAALCTVSVDAGAQFSLYGLGGELRSGFDSRETVVEIQYDPSLRPVAVLEQGVGQPRGCVERFTYGAPGVGDQQRNQYGQLIDHYDTAGQMRFDAFALGGQCTENTRRYTLDPRLLDWPQLPAERERLLEAPPGATTQWRYGALGDVLEQTDAKGNRQSFSQTVDGHLRESRLQPKGQPEKTVVSAIEYNDYGNVERETAGNGVQTRLSYRAADGRLISREDKHSGAVLQHLIYAYDRMGNVLSIEDKALPIRYFASQRIDPVSRFDYDSLYQLIHAFGWEAGSVSQGPQSIGRADPAAIGNYQQTFDYDAAGNLLKLTHVGPQSHGRKLQAARYSNRCLPWEGDVPPSEAKIAAAYDRRGNLLEIDKGRSLRWNLRNQLHSVSPVERASGLEDSEIYVYDGSGQRVRKIRSLHTNARSVIAEVRYLSGGLELRSDSGTGERLQVINIKGALNTIRVLVWDSPPPMGNHQYRYGCADHLGSTSLETADDGTIISRERFHPFGGTASQDGDLAYKFVRYSGKERDATGLDYYGLRYYIPWLQRWASADPAGYADGSNLYRMTHNNPVNFVDDDGAVTRQQLPNGLWAPVIATGADRVIAGARNVESGPPHRSVPASGKPTSISSALNAAEFGRLEVSTQFLDPAPGRYSPATVAHLSRKQGGGEMIFTMDRVSYSGVAKGEFNALRIVDIPRGEVPDKNSAVSGFWAPQGGFVDIPLHPAGTQPDHVFTPGFSGCSLTVDQLNDNVLRVRHVEGGKEDAQYNKLPAQEHGMGQAAAMEFADYGYAKDQQGRSETVTTGFAFMKYDRKQQAWNIHHQTIQGASGIERYTPGGGGIFSRSNASVSVYSKYRVRNAMARKIMTSNRRSAG
ncbi:RHS repeat domain-containing protein [Pseudomonas sp. TWP3-2]|uniref:RHS repeat domain-containing protein n=1 Tax=Pseudomonas sp. TWP3-2 TaxID=2804574 RepID=UPI003CFAAE81